MKKIFNEKMILNIVKGLMIAIVIFAMVDNYEGRMGYIEICINNNKSYDRAIFNLIKTTVYYLVAIVTIVIIPASKVLEVAQELKFKISIKFNKLTDLEQELTNAVNELYGLKTVVRLCKIDDETIDGVCMFGGKAIMVDTEKSTSLFDFYKILAHEIQHCIQHRDNKKIFKDYTTNSFELYYNHPSEVEARAYEFEGAEFLFENTLRELQYKLEEKIFYNR